MNENLTSRKKLTLARRLQQAIIQRRNKILGFKKGCQKEGKLLILRSS